MYSEKKVWKEPRANTGYEVIPNIFNRRSFRHSSRPWLALSCTDAPNKLYNYHDKKNPNQLLGHMLACGRVAELGCCLKWPFWVDDASK